MKILHLSAHLGGGAGKAISEMALLQAKDNEIKIILIEKPIDRRHIDTLTGIVDVLFLDECRLDSLLSWSDVVIINWWCHPLMVKLLASLPEVDCRLVIWNHVNGCSFPFLPFDFLNAFEKVIFTSGFSFENQLWGRKEKHIIWSKAYLVYGMGNYQPANVVHKSDYTRGKSFTVGYIGTVNYGKMAVDYLDYCLEAAKKIENIKFVIVGNPDSKVLEDFKNSSISDKVLFVGQVKDVEQYYKSFDVLGYILNHDSFATTENVLLEAMAYGLPVIVKANNVEQRIIHDGVNGYVVKNKEEYAEELRYLFDHPQECRSIGEKAREHCISVYKQYENKKVFDNVLVQTMDHPKKTYTFETLLGSDPIDWFLFFTGDDRSIFEDYLDSPTDHNRKKLVECKPIYKEKTKSSVLHFLSYFNDSRLQSLADVIIGGNGIESKD